MTEPLAVIDDKAARGLDRVAHAFKASYGSSPVHLVGVAASFVIAFEAAKHVFDADPHWVRYAVWFVGAALVHDLVLFPLYAALDRGAGLLRSRVRSRPSAGGSSAGGSSAGGINAGGINAGGINYVRAPALLSGLLLITFAGAIRRGGEAPFFNAAGKDQDPFFLRWVLITVVLFAVSGLLYLVRRRRS